MSVSGVVGGCGWQSEVRKKETMTLLQGCRGGSRASDAFGSGSALVASTANCPTTGIHTI